MAKIAGYIVTIKAFVPSSKTDFAAQAKAATLMAELTASKSLPENFAEFATITDVTAKYGSVDDAQG